MYFVSVNYWFNWIGLVPSIKLNAQRIPSVYPQQNFISYNYNAIQTSQPAPTFAIYSLPYDPDLLVLHHKFLILDLQSPCL